MTAVQKSNHWSEYWAGGNLTSLPQDFRANYDGEIAQFWYAQFSHIPEHGKLIDLCTGNGAVVLLAAAWCQARSIATQLYGVDAARIDPRAIARSYPDLAQLLSTITLISDCPVEDIDLPSEEFDLVTSQYGIEYCDWRLAAAQVSRLLKPGGHFAFLSHAVSTDIVSYMETESREYELLDEMGFLSGIRRYLQGGLNIRGFQEVLKQSRAAVSGEYQVSNSPFLATVLNMLTSVVSMDEGTVVQNQARLDQFQREISFGRERLNDLLRVNRAIQSDPGWYRVFEQQGLDLVESGDILYQGVHNSGQYYCFVKPV